MDSAQNRSSYVRENNVSFIVHHLNEIASGTRGRDIVPRV